MYIGMCCYFLLYRHLYRYDEKDLIYFSTVVFKISYYTRINMSYTYIISIPILIPTLNTVY